MIGEDFVAFALQVSGELLGVFAREAIDDDGLALVFFEKSDQLAISAFLFDDFEMEIGTVETGDEDLGFL